MRYAAPDSPTPLLIVSGWAGGASSVFSRSRPRDKGQAAKALVGIREASRIGRGGHRPPLVILVFVLLVSIVLLVLLVVVLVFLVAVFVGLIAPVLVHSPRPRLSCPPQRFSPPPPPYPCFPPPSSSSLSVRPRALTRD
eukprot:9490884-Pyramimonas_sp.AAC.1